MRSQRGAQDVRRRNGRASHAHHPNHRHSRASAHGRRLSQHPARRECRRQGLVGRASAALPEGDLLGAEEIPALKRGALAFVFGPNRKSAIALQDVPTAPLADKVNATPGSARYATALRADRLRDNKSEKLVLFYFFLLSSLVQKDPSTSPFVLRVLSANRSIVLHRKEHDKISALRFFLGNPRPSGSPRFVLAVSRPFGFHTDAWQAHRRYFLGTSKISFG